MKRAVVCITMILLVTAFCGALRGPEVYTGHLDALPLFESDGYQLACTTLEVEKSLEFHKRESEYEASLEACLVCPSDVDAVCVQEGLIVNRVIGASEQRNLLKKPPRIKKDQYNAFHEKRACVEIKKLELSGPGETISQLDVTAPVIVAKKRVNKEIAPIVMEDFQSLLPNMAVRITTLKMDKERELTVVLEYRSHSGGPFLEEVHVLDDAGKRLTGGRWTYGSPIGAKGKFTGEYIMPAGAIHSRLELVFCTEYETVKVPFTISEVFQK